MNCSLHHNLPLSEVWEYEDWEAPKKRINKYQNQGL
jgi:hypothetical protein